MNATRRTEKDNERIYTAMPDEVKRLFRDICEADDALGKASDHEGTDAGPTFEMWMQGHERYSFHCDALISWHKRALQLLRKAKRMSAKHTRQQNPQPEGKGE